MNTSPAAPVVSVIMPAYNAEKTIVRAVESVLSQDFADFELLVVDDGSRDQTAERVAAVNDSRIRILTHPGGVNRSAVASRRLAMLESRGEFIAFLDADDEYLPGKLARHVDILRRNPGVVMVHGPVQRRMEETSVPEMWNFSQGDAPKIYDLTKIHHYLVGNAICNPTAVCRRNAIEPERDQPPNMVGGAEDWILWICMAERGLFYYDPEPLTVYVYHAASFTHQLQLKPGAAELTAIEFYLSVLPRLTRWHRRVRALAFLIYHLVMLADIRRGPALKPGWMMRLVHRATLSARNSRRQ